MEERERSEEECPKELRIAYAKSDFAGRVNMQSGITVRSEPLRLTVEPGREGAEGQGRHAHGR